MDFVAASNLFSEDRLEGVMEDDFLPSHSYVVTYSSILQRMRRNNINPDT